MDRIDLSATAPAAEQPAAVSGVGSTFRAVAQGASVERRRRSTRGTPRPGRALTAPDASTTDSGTWRLAL